MGAAYAEGQGVKQNLIEALMYFSLASGFADDEDAGQKQTKDGARTIAKLMSHHDITAAQEKARKWLQQHPGARP